MAPSTPATTTAAGGTPELLDDLGAIRRKEPLAGTLVSIILSLVALTTLSFFMSKFTNVKAWRRVPFVQWLVFAIYVDSFLFVFATAIIQHGFGVDKSFSICEAAILLCLVCYVTTKLIYLFLVEKAHIIRGTPKSRMKSKLYLFNSFGMIGLYIVIVVLNFVFRIVRLDGGTCIIGMRRPVMIPLITFDLLVNVYLTILFLIPLSSLYSFKHPKQKMPASIRLRSIARRTLIGSLCTLVSSIVNLTVLMVLNGEQGWVCLICCNSDILFSAIMIHWVTSRDHIAAGSRAENSCYQNYARDDFDGHNSNNNRGRDASSSGVVAIRADGGGGGGGGGSSSSKSALDDDDDLVDLSLALSLTRLDVDVDAGDGSETPSTAGLSGKTARSLEPMPIRPPNALMPSSSTSR